MENSINSKIGTFSSIGIESFLYYIAFACYLISVELSLVNIEGICGISLEDIRFFFQSIALFALLFKALIQQYSVLQLLVSVALIGICFLSWRYSNANLMFWASLFIVSGQGICLRAIAKIAFSVYLIIFVLTVFFALSGVIDSAYMERGSDYYARSSMGFAHPNYFGRFLFEICISFALMREGKFDWKVIVLCCISICLIANASDSRTAMVGIVFLLLSLFVYNLLKGRKRILLILFSLMFVCVVISSYYIMFFYNPSNYIESQLNELLTGRMYLANFYYSIGGFHLLGNNFSDAPVLHYRMGDTNLILDNSFCLMLLRDGILVAFFFFLGTVILIVKAYKANSFNICLLGFFVVGFVGLSEAYMVGFDTNYCMLAFSAALFSKPIDSLDPSIETAKNKINKGRYRD